MGNQLQVDNLRWIDITGGARTTIESITQNSIIFVNPQWFTDNPLKIVAPLLGFNHFYATDTLNILIISRDYGWSGDDFQWPQEEIDAIAARVQETYPRFVGYKTIIFIDFGMAEEIDSIAIDSNYVGHMEQVEVKIQELCTALAAFGFEYGGRVDYRDTDSSFFVSIILNHYSIEAT